MGRLDFMFAFVPDPAGCFLGSEYPEHDGRWPYDEYRGPGHQIWWQEIMSKQKARCHYDTDHARVFFTTRAAPGLVDGMYRLVDVSELKHRPWVPVAPRQIGLLMDILFALRNGTLPRGRIYLSDRESLSVVTKCLFLPDEDVAPEEKSAPAEAVRRGFLRRGLATAELETVVSCARAEPWHPDEHPPHVDHLFTVLQRCRGLHPDSFPVER